MISDWTIYGIIFDDSENGEFDLTCPACAKKRLADEFGDDVPTWDAFRQAYLGNSSPLGSHAHRLGGDGAKVFPAISVEIDQDFETETCDVCDGTGSVTLGDDTEEVPCDACDGDGYLPLCCVDCGKDIYA